MTYILYKSSKPGWKKEYESAGDLKTELSSWVCGQCREDFESEYGEPIQSIRDMLGTACGCEFDFENTRYEPWYEEE
jgi:hypothetical protein